MKRLLQLRRMIMDKKILLALDIGNVCVKIDHHNCIKRLPSGIVPDELLAAAHDYECGIITAEDEFIERSVKILKGNFSAAEFKEAFDSIIISPVPGMTELVNNFSVMGVEAVFFSDISPTHLRRTQEVFPAFSAVSGGVFSFDAGDWKPSLKMFNRFETMYRVPDLYVDDREELIIGARQHGWNAHVFVSAQDLTEKLHALS